MTQMESPKRKMQKRNDYQRHKLFRKIKRRRKAQAEADQQIAVKQLRKKLKFPKFGDGKGIKSDTGAPLEVKDGMLYYKETGEPFNSAGLQLPEVEIVGDKSKVNPWAAAGKHNASSYFDGNWSKDLINMTPGVGDAMDIAQAIVDSSNGKYIAAGSGLAMLALPNFIEKPFKYIGKRSMPFIRRYLDKINFKGFKSELDWSPESWLSKRTDKKWTKKDEDALASHLQEYLDIEKNSKNNGTWLKNEDGSVWSGDPRSWVQMQSKAFNENGWRKLDKPMHTGIPVYNLQSFPTYNGSVWMSDSPEVYGHFGNLNIPGNKHFDKTYPEGAAGIVTDQKSGLYATYDYNGTPYNGSGGYDHSDDLEKMAKDSNVSAMELNNVIEGPSIKYSKDDLHSGLPSNDLVIINGAPRKSLIGNNGNFDAADKNIYRALIPLIGAGGLYATYNDSYNSGKDIHIKKSKRGTFTKAAKQHGMSVQGFANKVLRNPSKYSAAMRKKANFAHNAASWKH